MEDKENSKHFDYGKSIKNGESFEKNIGNNIQNKVYNINIYIIFICLIVC